MARERVLVIDKGERERERERADLCTYKVHVLRLKSMYILRSRAAAHQRLSHGARDRCHVYICVCVCYSARIIRVYVV